MSVYLPARARLGRRPWLVYACLVGVAAALYLPPGSPFNKAVVFNAIGLSAVVAILVGQRINRPSTRLPWRLFAAGQALFVVGDILAYNYTRFFHAELPFPSIADAAYIAVYPALIAGLVILIRERTPMHDRGSLIDSAVVATGFGVLSWTSLMAPYAHDGSLGLPTQLISVAYPLMDLALLTVGIRLAMGAGRRGTAFYLLMSGFAALLATDSIYGWFLLHGGYETGGLLDGGWIVFYCLVGTAALHPSMRKLSERAPEHETGLTMRRLVLLASVVLLAPLVQALHLIAGTYVDMPVVLGGSVVLFLLVAARMAGEAQRSNEAARRERALHMGAVALASAGSREAVLVAAREGAELLVGRDRLVAVYAGSEEWLEAVHDIQKGAGLGDTWRYAALSADVRASLSARRAVRLPAHRAVSAGLVTSTEWAAELCVAPVMVQGELRGTLVVSGPSLAGPVKDALERLAVEVGLAEESAELTEERLRTKSEARFASLFQNSSDIVAVLGRDRTVQYVSPAVERHLARPVAEVEGASLSEVVHADDFLRLSGFLANSVAQPSDPDTAIELRLTRRDGTFLEVEALVTNLMNDQNVSGIVLNMRDITERKAFQEQLAHHAFHDPLTGLANRALFEDRVAHALRRQPRGDGSVAVLYVDVDDFKAINDRLGHAAGDAILGEVAERLSQVIRGADTAARLGGDEFAVLLDGLDADLTAVTMAKRILASFASPMPYGGGELTIGVSVGVALADADCDPAAAWDLIRNSDAAMYLAKERGKGQYQLFAREMHVAALDRLRLKDDLERGIEQREIVVHYQPVMALDTGLMTGVEALARWEHPTRGLLGPGEFIPLAEETGLVVALGKLVLEAACEEAAVLQRKASGPPLGMSVNLSARQLQEPAIVDDVRAAIERSGIEPSSLILEITESAMMEDVDAAVLRLHELKAAGVRIAIDDFGTGHSSLNYIRQFPIDVLKIDRSFIVDMTEPGDIAALVATIVDLAGILGLDAVAEGVETPEQLERLVKLGCGYAQGFLFHRPMEASAIEAIAARQAAGRAVA